MERSNSKMALNKNERDLLAIVKHFNSQRKPIAKLVTKLYDGFDLAATSDLTGFTHDEIIALMESAKPRKYTKKAKQIDIDQAGSAEVWVHAPQPEINFDNETLSGRIAQELYKEWGTR